MEMEYEGRDVRQKAYAVRDDSDIVVHFLVRIVYRFIQYASLCACAFPLHYFR